MKHAVLQNFRTNSIRKMEFFAFWGQRTYFSMILVKTEQKFQMVCGKEENARAFTRAQSHKWNFQGQEPGLSISGWFSRRYVLTGLKFA